MKRILTILFAVWCSLCLGANITWEGDDSDDWNTGSNWLGGTKPGGSDVAEFDGATSSNNCTLDSDESLLGISVEADYTGTIDLANGGHTLTIGSSGAVIAGNAGSTWDMGDCTLAITGGPWTVNAHAGTWTIDASTVTFDGACAISTGFTNDFYNLTSTSGTTSVSTNHTEVNNTCTINGILSVNTGKYLRLATGGTVVIGDGGQLTGAGTGIVQFLSSGSGKGVTAFHANGTWDIPVTQFYRPDTAAVLAPGNYQSAFRVYVVTAAAYTLTLSNGDYTFTSLELECTDGGGSITLDTTACVDDTITTGDLTIDDQAGAVTITDTATAVDWDVSGNMATTGAGTFLWNQGTGTKTFSGTANQAIDSNDVDIGTWLISKANAGTVNFNDGQLTLGNFTMADNLTAVSSTIDSTASTTKTIAGDVDFTDVNNDISLGTGTVWALTDGTWATVGADTFARGTSTVTFAGTSTINTGTTNDFYNMQVSSGTATVSTNHTEVANTCTINGTLSIDVAKTLYAGGNAIVVIGDGGRLTGAGTITMGNLASDKGITTFHAGGTIDVATFNILQPNAAAVFRPGNYQSAVRVYNASASNYTLTLDAAGAYQFDKLELETTSTGTLMLDNTNGPTSITINGDLTFDRDDLDPGEGVITVNDSGVATNWIVTGDVLNQGAATWTKGTGTITAQASPYLKNGGGFSFNGSSDEVDINAQVHNFATDFTIAAWVRVPAVTEAEQRFFTQGINCLFRVTIDGRLSYYTNGDNTSTGTGVFSVNTWHLVMVTYDDSGTDVVKLYVDNVEQATEDKTATNTAADSRIGSYLGSTHWFDGHIADVRVWDKALSTAERAELYNSGAGTTNTVADGNCVGWWLMDESAADKIAVDGGTGSNDGTSIQNTNVIRAPYNQAWDWSALTGEIEGVIVNKPFGTLTLTDDIDCTSWTQTDGTVEFNDVTITTTGNVTFSSGADGLATYLDGTTWTVGGNFTATGTSAASKLDMTAAGGWILNVTGTGSASYVNVANSNATGSAAPISASTSTNRDGGGNQNWNFTVRGGDIAKVDMRRWKPRPRFVSPLSMGL